MSKLNRSDNINIILQRKWRFCEPKEPESDVSIEMGSGVIAHP